MKFFKNIALLIVLTTCINSIQAKQMGQKNVSQGYGQQQQIPTGPVQEPIIPNIPNQPFTSGPTYTDILALFRDKNPDSSDFSTLKNIKNEAETQINFLKNRQMDTRAKINRINDIREIQTYSDIYRALQQRLADSSDYSTLNNIKIEAEGQLRKLENAMHRNPVIQAKTGELTYSQILNALKQNTPDSSDFSTLNNIINEAQNQKNYLLDVAK
jgi:hypothetical protein